MHLALCLSQSRTARTSEHRSKRLKRALPRWPVKSTKNPCSSRRLRHPSPSRAMQLPRSPAPSWSLSASGRSPRPRCPAPPRWGPARKEPTSSSERVGAQETAARQAFETACERPQIADANQGAIKGHGGSCNAGHSKMIPPPAGRVDEPRGQAWFQLQESPRLRHAARHIHAGHLSRREVPE